MAALTVARGLFSSSILSLPCPATVLKPASDEYVQQVLRSNPAVQVRANTAPCQSAEGGRLQGQSACVRAAAGSLLLLLRLLSLPCALTLAL